MSARDRYRLIVVSDSHGNASVVERLLPVLTESDYVLHLGDGSADMNVLRGRIKGELVCVRGNCDLFGGFPAETVLTVGQSKFFLAHGHAYGVKVSPYRLADRAEALGCRYALFGHTHRAEITPVGGVTLINPGALSFSHGNRPSYAEITGDGDVFRAKILVL